MISVSEAQQIIQSQLFTLDSTTIAYDELLGRVLAEDILALRPQPPFDRVTMDGIAIRSEDYLNSETSSETPSETSFIKQGTQYAGQAALSLQAGHCIEVMTGAILPTHADCVIPIEQIQQLEQLTQKPNSYRIQEAFSNPEQIFAGRHIHKKGSDHSQDHILIKQGTQLDATHISCLVSAGYKQASVLKMPVITIIMSGDELVKPGETIEDFQIYASNAPTLKALLEKHHYSQVKCILIKDNQEQLQQVIAEALAESDLLITTGGVSMGKKDFLPEVLNNLNVDCHFHKVTQKPGKPLWFGSHSKANKKCLVFALPGNPISALVSARRYVIPALDKLCGKQTISQTVALSKDVTFKPKMTYFLPVSIQQQENSLHASPISFNTSGDTVSLMHSDGFIQLDAEQSEFSPGELVEYYSW